MSLNRPTFIARLCWTVAITVSILFYTQYGKESYNFYGDAMGYYMYLSSTFIYKNHKSIEELPTNKGIRPFIHSYAAQIGSGQRTPKGYVLNQYTYGIALLELPFFLTAHVWEYLRGGNGNGFSPSYQLAVMLSSLFYGFLGLWITYRVLKQYFSQPIASITAALILIGTNLFWFLFYQQGMAHVPLFFLFALLLHYTIKIYSVGSYPHFICLGFVAGRITVIRPIDGLCILIPILYNNGKPFLINKWNFIVSHWHKILIAGCSFVVPIIPQLLYWKWLTGYWVYDSYGPNQAFDFLHPKLLAGLFGPSNGWLFYTPLMLLAIAGLLFRKNYRPFVGAICLFLVLYTWAIYSWFLPNYINGLGSRPMIDAYPLLALPLAACINEVARLKLGIKVLISGFVLLFAYINISYSVKKSMGVINTEDSKYNFNLLTIFKYSLNYNDLVLWDIGVPQPDQVLGEPIIQRCTSLTDSSYSSHIVLDSSERKKVFAVQKGEEYSPVQVTVTGENMTGRNYKWIKCSGRFRTTMPEYDIYSNQLLVLQIKRGKDVINWYGVRINNKVGLLEQELNLKAGLFAFRDNIWGTVSYYIPFPKEIRPSDVLQLDVWDLPKKPIAIAQLCVEIYR